MYGRQLVYQYGFADDETTREIVRVNTIDGAVSMFPAGPARSMQNRYQDGINDSTRKNVTWVDPVYEVTIVPTLDAAGDTVLVTFDAPNDSVADVWLTEASAGSATDDVMYRQLLVSGNEYTFYFPEGCNRIDLKGAASGTFTNPATVFIGAS